MTSPDTNPPPDSDTKRLDDREAAFVCVTIYGAVTVCMGLAALGAYREGKQQK